MKDSIFNKRKKSTGTPLNSQNLCQHAHHLHLSNSESAPVLRKGIDTGPDPHPRSYL